MTGPVWNFLQIFSYLFQNQRPLFLSPILLEKYSNSQVRINKILSEHHISLDSLGLYLSKIFVEFSVKPAYSTIVGANFEVLWKINF